MNRLIAALAVAASLLVAACEPRSPVPPGPSPAPQPKVSQK
jgi:hypothetical protein